MFHRIKLYKTFVFFLAIFLPVNVSFAQSDAEPSISEINKISSFEILLLVLLLICIFLLSYFILQRKKILSKTKPDNHEESLKESSLLHILIDNMPDRIYIKDRKSRFLAANIHVANIMGEKDPMNLIGKTDLDFYSKELGQEYYIDEQELMKSGESLINKEERGLDLKGNEIIVSTTKVPIKNEQGQIIGIVGMGRDITPQKQTERKLIDQQEKLQEANTLLEERQEEVQQQSEELHVQSEFLVRANKEMEKLSMVASHTDNVIIIMDADANIEYRNRGYERHYGKNIEEQKNKEVINLRNISSNKDIDSVIKEILKSKKPVSYEGKAHDKNGKEFWSQTTISPVLDGKNEVLKLIAIDSDITEIKAADDEIKRQKNEIEKNRDDLKKLNATKDKFFSIIAHDLKNPFHSIMGFSDLLIKSYDSIEKTKKKEFLQLIKESSTTAYNLLENLLHWSRAQTNTIQFNPARLNISQIILENVQMQGVTAQNKEIEVLHIMPDQLIVSADENMISTVIRNLLSNALKFTPKGGKITIKASSENDTVNVSISDTGLGMDDATMTRLFKIDEFHNTIGTSGETGTGLGLIICQEFIQRHGGKINVESVSGKGSIFSFSLPLAS